MKVRAFGRTGLEISQIVFGGGNVGGILIHADEATRFAALRRAVAAGVNWIDTAPSYGNGVSETTIGRYLPELSPRPLVSTKVMLGDDADGDLAGAIERSLEHSLERLRLDRFELFQLHNPIGSRGGPRTVTPELVLRRGGVADVLDRLRGQGLFKASGFTAVGDTASVLEVVRSGRFAAAQVYYNLLNPSAGWARAPAGWSAQDFSGLLQACREHDVAVMNIRVFAAGVLASTRRHGREGPITSGAEIEREAARAAAVHRVLGERHGTPAQTALRFSLANPDIACVIVGIAELDYLEQAIAACRLGPLPSATIATLEPLWSSDFHRA